MEAPLLRECGGHAKACNTWAERSGVGFRDSIALFLLSSDVDAFLRRSVISLTKMSSAAILDQNLTRDENFAAAVPLRSGPPFAFGIVYLVPGSWCVFRRGRRRRLLFSDSLGFAVGCVRVSLLSSPSECDPFCGAAVVGPRATLKPRRNC